jgi:prepilin-type N-terminal cleavage/methylation domain-containing protein
MTDRQHEAGFTLLEVLVALAVTGFLLASIGSLAASSIRGTWEIESRLTSRATAQAVLATFPEGRPLKARYGGQSNSATWTLRVLPYPFSERDDNWEARELIVEVQPRRGAPFTLNAIRLVPRVRP